MTNSGASSFLKSGSGVRPDSIGAVIGTYAGVPYVHMQLESRRRNYPHLPLLVHDDASHRSDELAELCHRYGAEFQSHAFDTTGHNRRLGHKLGDLAVFLGGLNWASRRDLDVVVKLSRRFLPLTDWVSGLVALSSRSPAATFGDYYLSRKDSIRTDCVALRVQPWLAARRHEALRRTIDEATVRDSESLFVEHLMLLNARAAARSTRTAGGRALARWPFVSRPLARSERARCLWHDIHWGGDYYRVSNGWGLRYSLAEYEGDPNS